MKLNDLFDALESSNIYKKFKAENPESFLCAGFFILDIKENREEYNLDYTNGTMITSFTIPEDSEMITSKTDEVLDSSKPLNKVSLDVVLDLDNLIGKVEEEIIKNYKQKKLEKIIAVLQNSDGKTIWNLTCMLEGLAIVSIKIDANTEEILVSEKRSLFDVVRLGEK